MIDEDKKPAAEVSKTAGSKNIYIATSAMTVGVKKQKDETYVAEPKSGGVAPGILNALPAEYKLKGWRGIVKSQGTEIDKKSEQALKEFGIKQGFDAPDAKGQTFQNQFVEENDFFEFYVNATNGTVWPLIHDMPEKRGRTADFETLSTVDQTYSDDLFKQILLDLKEENLTLPEGEQKTLDDVVIWAHDYHVFNVPGMMQELAANLPDGDPLKGSPNISFFHHEPWPAISPEASPDGGRGVKDGVVYADFNPSDAAEFKKTLENLVQADTLGFHTEGDAVGFLATAEKFGVTSPDLEKRVFVDPIGSPKSNMRQNADIRMPFLQEGLASDSVLNQELRKPQRGEDGVVSTIQDPIRATALEFKGKAMQEVVDFSAKVNELSKKTNPTENEQQMIEAEPGITNRMMNGGATPYDKMTVSEQVYFDPEKTHINSVQRFDYTKGIAEFLKGYQQFLQDLKEQGVANPEKEFQFNLITGAGRSGDQVHEYTQYEKKTKKIMNEIKEEFPGALYHFKAGIPNPELPIANAATDIVLVSSVADGYVIAGPEIIESIIAAGERGMLPQDYNPQLIVSSTVGLARDLDNLPPNTPERLQMVVPTPENFTAALHKARANRLAKKDIGPENALKDLQTISDVLPAAEGDFGKIATTVMEGARTDARATAEQMRVEFRDVRQEKYFQPKEVRDQERQQAREAQQPAREASPATTETVAAVPAVAASTSPFAGLGATAQSPVTRAKHTRKPSAAIAAKQKKFSGPK